ncbi:MAG: DNA-3-methyladenine glycosylase family protein [Candidatus Nanohaloarchaea archaeon]
MKTHQIPAEDFDLELTLTCGQTFCWNRTEGELYGDGSSRFYSFRKEEPMIVEQRGEIIRAETPLPEKEVKKALGLDNDLENIFSTFPEDQKLQHALNELEGLRIVQDEFFPTLISYLCSPQMKIPRIKEMHNSIAERYGETVEYGGEKLLKFPTLQQLSKASEKELRDLGLGYRAEYVVKTVEILQGEGLAVSDDYEAAREDLKKLYGVGDKVADCVLLFSLGFYEAYPLDTWALKVVEKDYPDLYSGSYEEASKNLRHYFGPYSGYAQEYLFHAARKGVIEV